MRVYKFPNLRGNSIDRLETTYEVHIKPVLGFLPLSQINSDDIQMLINAKAQELSYSYIKKNLRVSQWFLQICEAARHHHNKSL